MDELIEQINSLSAKYPSLVKLYSPCNFLKQYLRCEGQFPNKFDDDYKELLLFSNGISVLGYCIFGCKNRKIADIVDESFNVWSSYEVSPQFISFMSSMNNEIFGFITEDKISKSSQKFSIAVLQEDDYDKGFRVVSSSFREFLAVFIEELKHTLENPRNKDEILLTLNNEFWK